MTMLKLPDDVLTDSADSWSHPTPAEIRAVIGEAGLSVSDAARLVGVNSSNFKKYIRHEGAATVSKMSFAMWHLLMHRTGVRTAKVVQKAI